MSNMQVIKASAGSGKTYTLAKRFLEEMLFVVRGGKMELRGTRDYFEHIMAITFTNKATNEMKSRIVDELYTLARDVNQSDYYNNEWKGKCTQEALDGLQQAARDGLACILFNYSAFKVSTIDSFFQSVLRSFARELDRDYNYDLTLDGDYAAAVAAHKFLLSLGHDAARTGNKTTPAENWVKDYIRDRINDNKGWNTIFGTSDASLSKFASKINNEFFRENMPALREYLSADDDGKSLGRINTVAKLFKDLAEEYEKKITDSETIQTEFQKLAKELALDTKDFFTGRLIYSLYNSGTCTEQALRDNCDGCKSSLFKNKFMPDASQDEKLCEYFKKLLKYIDYSLLLNDMARKLSYVGLIGEINKKLEEYREESNTVLIADTNELIGKVVQSSEAPFIYERISTWINHFMLDEFQDTSNKQYTNFLPLLLESLDNGYANLIIGDSKQAIYRFRNADPSLFRERIDRDFSRYIKPDTLGTNWRSYKSVIDFNNEFIERFLAYFGDLNDTTGKYPYPTLRATYMPTGKKDDYTQEISGKKGRKHPGLVRVHFGAPSIDGSDGKAFKKVEDVLSSLTEHLKDMHKRFAWSDINILVNKKDDGKAVVTHLLEHNKKNPEDIIPVVSGELMRLDQSSAVRRLVSMLQFIDLTSYALSEDSNEDLTEMDNDIKARANRRRMKQQRQFRVLERFVERLVNHDDIPEVDAGNVLMECFDETDKLTGKDAKEQMQTYADDLNSRLPNQRSQTMSLVNIVETLIKKSIKADERDKENIFLHAFLNCVVDFCSKRNGGTVREFLQHWNQNKEKITVPDSGTNDAIKVYTIHASKGLEADCVVIPCANWDLDTNAMDRDYWVTGKEWLDCGGRQLLNEIADGRWSEEMIPPILSASKSKMRAFKTYGMFDNICDPQDEALLIDNVNKTYVAFTRPRKELHIYSVGGPRGNSATVSINHVLESVVRGGKMNEAKDGKSLFVKVNDMQYDMGAPYEEMPEDKKGEEKNDKESFHNQPLPAYTVSETMVEVSLPDDDVSAREIGKRLHALLSRISYSNQLDKALSYCERRGIINSSDPQWNTAHLKEFLGQKFAEEPYASWFSLDNKVYNERPLLVVDVKGNKDVKRPDRIVLRPDGNYIIVDYKFGHRTEENDVKYTRQVKQYMDALAKTTDASIKGFVWYVTDDSTLEVE